MQESVRQKLATRVARLEQQIKAFKELHASELGLILDELASLRAELDAMAPPATDSEQPPAAPSSDPAAASPRRAAWLAEQARRDEERRAPMSRRDFLRGGTREAEEREAED